MFKCLLKADVFEKYIIDYLNDKIFSEKNIKKIVEMSNKNLESEREKLLKEEKNLKENLRKIDLKIKNIYKAIESGINQKLLGKRLDELIEKREEILNNLESIKKESIKKYSEKDFVKLVEIFKEKLKKLPPEELNQYLKIFIHTIFIDEKL